MHIKIYIKQLILFNHYLSKIYSNKIKLYKKKIYYKENFSAYNQDKMLHL